MRFLPGLFTFGISATEIPKHGPTSFRCFHIGEDIEHALDKTGCAQVFDTIETANFACSLFEDCLLIGHNTEGYFELFDEN